MLHGRREQCNQNIWQEEEENDMDVAYNESITFDGCTITYRYTDILASKLEFSSTASADNVAREVAARNNFLDDIKMHIFQFKEYTADDKTTHFKSQLVGLHFVFS